MYNKISTREFAEYYCSKVVSDYLDKKYTSDYTFDFKITKVDLPHDFNIDVFLEVFKTNFNIKRIEYNDLDYCILVFGTIKCGNFTRVDFIESLEALRSFRQIFTKLEGLLMILAKQLNLSV
jgi:hypothetical protein